MKADLVILFILRSDGLYDVVRARRRSDWPGYLQARSEWWQLGERSVGRTYGKPWRPDAERGETRPSIRHPGPRLFAVGIEGESLLLPETHAAAQEDRQRLIEQTAIRRVVGERTRARRVDQIQTILAMCVLVGMLIMAAVFAPTIIDRVSEVSPVDLLPSSESESATPEAAPDDPGSVSYVVGAGSVRRTDI